MASLLAAATALLLLPSEVVGQLVSASEFPALEREFERMVDGQRRAHHHHRFRRHLRHHKRAALFAAPSGGEAREQSPEERIRAPSPDDLLSGRHPSVARNLANMNEEVQDLKGRKQLVATSREELENHIKKASQHMSEAVGIKREIARTEFQLRHEEMKLKRLEDDRLRLDRSHDHLVSSLHHIMEPKIQFAEDSLATKQRRWHKSETKVAAWEERESKLHAAALLRLKERKDDKLKLETAVERAKVARREEELAKKQLEGAKHSVTSIVQDFKFAQTKAEASRSQEERAEQMFEEAQKSVKRMRSILSMEEKRVDESMALGKDRVDGSIQKLQAKKLKSSSKINTLKKEYGTWEGRERVWARKVAAKKQVTNDVSQEFAARHQKVMHEAEVKAGRDAESGSDWAWDEWPGKHAADTEEVHLPVE